MGAPLVLLPWWSCWRKQRGCQGDDDRRLSADPSRLALAVIDLSLERRWQLNVPWLSPLQAGLVYGTGISDMPSS